METGKIYIIFKLSYMSSLIFRKTIILILSSVSGPSAVSSDASIPILCLACSYLKLSFNILCFTVSLTPQTNVMNYITVLMVIEATLLLFSHFTAIEEQNNV